jgi:hypothetical protein
MVKPLYRVYIDEAGDRGWGGRSSETFVVSAVIVKDADDKAVRQSVDQLSSQLGKSPGTVLHWAENVRTHTSRKHCAREIAKLPVTLANVVIVKNSLVASLGMSMTRAAKLSSPSLMSAASRIRR